MWHALVFTIEHDLLIGIEDSREQRNPDLSTSAATSDPSLAHAYGVDPYNPQWVAPKTPRGAARTSNRHRAESQALYMQDLMQFGAHWKVLAGRRTAHGAGEHQLRVLSGGRARSCHKKTGARRRPFSVSADP